MKWLREHWMAVVIGAVLFLVGVGIGAAGTSSDGSQPAAQTVVEAQGATLTEQAETVTVTESVTETESVKAKPQASAKHVYTGNGSKKLTIKTGGGKLRWTNDGDLFQLWTDDVSTVFVNSQAHSGTTEVPAGHHKLTVNALGNWLIRVPSDREQLPSE